MVRTYAGKFFFSFFLNHEYLYTLVRDIDGRVRSLYNTYPPTYLLVQPSILDILDRHTFYETIFLLLLLIPIPIPIPPTLNLPVHLLLNAVDVSNQPPNQRMNTRYGMNLPVTLTAATSIPRQSREKHVLTSELGVHWRFLPW